MNGPAVIGIVLTIACLLVAASQIIGSIARDEWQRAVDEEARRRDALR